LYLVSILSRLGKKEPQGTKIVVKNLKYDILEDDVKELFATVGEVKKAEIVYDRSGRSTVYWLLSIIVQF
jgi:THO complex subunit 4